MTLHRRHPVLTPVFSPLLLFATTCQLAQAGFAQQLVAVNRAQASVAATLERVSRPLLGAEYRLSPLGEGSGVDRDPRFRRDAFDCTTFVETVVGLSLLGPSARGSSSDAIAMLDRLRYSGPPSYDHRLHFVAAQWLPSWQAMGLLVDVTGSTFDALGEGLAGRAGSQDEASRVPKATIELDPEIWLERRVALDLVLPEDLLPVGRYELPYVPVELAIEAIEQVPPGTLLNVVRRPTEGRPILVSHQALVLDGPAGERVVRHASAALGRVADQSAAQFVRILRQPKVWPVLGINLQRVNLPQSLASSADE